MLEEAIKKHPEIDFALQVGDFGAYLDDGASAKLPEHRRQISEFPQYLSGEKVFSKPVIFIKGNHEGFAYLKQLERDHKNANLIELATNLTYMPNGKMTEFMGVRIAAIGGNFSPAYFTKEVKESEDPLRFRHFRVSDFNALRQKRNVDILLTHDAGPDMVPSKRIMSAQCAHLSDWVREVQPTYWALGHYHMSYETTLGRTRIYGLNAIHYDGRSCVVLEKR
jgi:hypothetical protein